MPRPITYTVEFDTQRALAQARSLRSQMEREFRTLQLIPRNARIDAASSGRNIGRGIRFAMESELRNLDLIPQSALSEARSDIAQLRSEIQSLNQGQRGAARGVGGGAGLGLGQLVGAVGISVGAREIAQASVELEKLDTRAKITAQSLNLAAGGAANAQRSIALVREVSGNAVSGLAAAEFAATSFNLKLAETPAAVARLAEAVNTVLAVSPVIGTVDRAFQELALTISNRSTLRLDQLGLTIEDVGRDFKSLSTNAEAQERVLGALERRYGALGDVVRENRSSTEKLSAAWEDLRVEMASNLGPTLDTIFDKLTRLTEAATVDIGGGGLSDLSREIGRESTTAPGLTGLFGNDNNARQDQQERLVDLINAVTEAQRDGTIVSGDYIAALDEVGRQFLSQSTLLPEQVNVLAELEAGFSAAAGSARAFGLDAAAASDAVFLNQGAAIAEGVQLAAEQAALATAEFEKLTEAAVEFAELSTADNPIITAETVGDVESFVGDLEELASAAREGGEGGAEAERKIAELAAQSQNAGGVVGLLGGILLGTGADAIIAAGDISVMTAEVGNLISALGSLNAASSGVQSGILRSGTQLVDTVGLEEAQRLTREAIEQSTQEFDALRSTFESTGVIPDEIDLAFQEQAIEDRASQRIDALIDQQKEAEKAQRQAERDATRRSERVNREQASIQKRILSSAAKAQEVVGPAQARALAEAALAVLPTGFEGVDPSNISDLDLELLSADFQSQLLSPFDTIAESQKEAATAQKSAAKDQQAAARELESSLRSIPGLFGTSDVTAEQLKLAELGVPQNFADDYVRRLTDEVVNGVDWPEVDIQDAALRAGIDPNLPAEVILEQFRAAWDDSSLFADAENLDLINQDAVQDALDRQRLSLEGQQNILDLFGAGQQNLIDEFIGGGGRSSSGGVSFTPKLPEIDFDAMLAEIEATAQNDALARLTITPQFDAERVQEEAAALPGILVEILPNFANFEIPPEVQQAVRLTPDTTALDALPTAPAIDPALTGGGDAGADFTGGLNAQIAAITGEGALDGSMLSLANGMRTSFVTALEGVDLAGPFIGDMVTDFGAETAIASLTSIGSGIRSIINTGYGTVGGTDFAGPIVQSIATDFAREAIRNQLADVGRGMVEIILASYNAEAEDGDWSVPSTVVASQVLGELADALESP